MVWPLVYDSLILFYLLITAGWSLFIISQLRQPSSWWRLRLKTAFLILLLLISSGGIFFYGSFIEPQLISVSNYSLDLANPHPTESVKLALISDLHMGPYKKERWLKKIAKKLDALDPDAVLLAGDYIYDDQNESVYLEALVNITDLFPTFAVLGNHDYNLSYLNKKYRKIDEERALDVREELLNAGVEVLVNEPAELKMNNKSFYLVGIDEYLTQRADLTGALLGLDSNKPVVVLAHNPDFVLSEQHRLADVVLAGHTHGGQIRLPFIGSIPTIPDELGQEYDQGLFDYDGKPLIITRGISESGPRARLLAPPEIVMIEIKL